jgi:hypothetical protein
LQAPQKVVSTFTAKHLVECVGDLTTELPDFSVSLERTSLACELPGVHAVFGMDFAAKEKHLFPRWFLGSHG